MRACFVDSFSDLPGEISQALRAQGNNPFFHGAFLQALEDTGCVSPQTGWNPQHLWLADQNKPVFFLPLYRKSHSWGEFVFDQAWAQAYQRYGVAYYPKWITSIPFTPSLGPRWWCHPEYDEAALLECALAAIMDRLQSGAESSWHLLFSHLPPVVEQQLLVRKDVQFHWHNHGYASFDEFLEQLKSRKRKGLKRERQRVQEQGVSLQRKLGSQLTEADWVDYYGCYANTYHERGAEPYLSLEFFLSIAEPLADQIMMVQGMRQHKMIAAALCFFDKGTLYGRHWGALERVECLHFEACFYQGIEFCIEQGLQRFDPGTQGEHKLLRGFEPVPTQSWHLIAHSAFENAIADYLQAETEQIERYQGLARQHLPYRESS